MRKRPIIVTEADVRRLRRLLSAQSEASFRDQAHLQELRAELERALILQAQEVPAQIITMHSQVRVLDLERGRPRRLHAGVPVRVRCLGQAYFSTGSSGDRIVGLP